ncbi:tRNA (adenosine(37)-N6)-threonylcarbamoyltransferase complex transferase subunit TsaD [Deferribacterales bacterium Es71-Z0220]|uniref:tRNA (adenosine(37)-N6)-threonylcarbamoyltransferase complex transferase subunit TsaD n=1 Tax=Deferrivibrio essentukiensis TaxID=2880922 RepID=UPI001F60DA75|nr:tRNA (adenosine(37)-N6)-threonylcarbamoyltransferase complex transferase subunit TsaD [Deferrivibrio essentukiensis]MCB4205070.1 tRNA (adenosine(37)-N6)-threonylcarbamoyltransferase complex transferase subunit TsaD [Deferrivibrio essentukiensis]
MITLGIETSCDETSASIIDSGKNILSAKIFSQADIHKKFGGVVPEVASRNHALKIRPIVEEVINDAKISVNDIDLIGVTNSPGLIGALFVGVSFAKGLSYTLKKPLIPVNHLTAHILSGEIENDDLTPPYAALVISGGHTHLFHVSKSYAFTLISKTIDDAIGETFDKVSKTLGFGYPGGPEIEKNASFGDETKINYPIAMKNELNFSFSGLKTSVINSYNSEKYTKEDISASFQKIAVDTIIHKIRLASETQKISKLVVAGGVACNGYLRKRLQSELKNIRVFFPSKGLCTDNGVMVAYTAYQFFNKRIFMGFNSKAFDRDENIKLF